MRLLRLSQEATALVAASYVTLGIAASSTAEKLWAPYAGVTFVLALINLRGARRARR